MSKEKLSQTFRKPGEIFLKSRLKKHYKNIWLRNSKNTLKREKAQDYCTAVYKETHTKRSLHTQTLADTLHFIFWNN